MADLNVWAPGLASLLTAAIGYVGVRATARVQEKAKRDEGAAAIEVKRLDIEAQQVKDEHSWWETQLAENKLLMAKIAELNEAKYKAEIEIVRVKSEHQHETGNLKQEIEGLKYELAKYKRDLTDA